MNDDTKQSDDSDDAAKNGLTDDALNRIAKADRRRREQAEKQVAEMQAKLDALQKSALSEGEKKERDAYDKGLAEAGSKIAVERTIWAAEKALLLRGANPRAARMLDLDKLGTPEDVEAAVAELLADMPTLIATTPEAKEPVPFQPGAPRRAVAAKGIAPDASHITMEQVRAWTSDPKAFADKRQLIANAVRQGTVSAE